MTDRQLAVAIADIYNQAKTSSANKVAALIGVDPKQFRAKMRGLGLRDQEVHKGKPWKLTLADTITMVLHYRT